MTATELRDRIAGYLSSELACEMIDGRIACMTPLYYPNGDGVVVYVTQRNDQFEVTDFSESYRALLIQGDVEASRYARGAEAVCAGLDVGFRSGRIHTVAELGMLDDAVWRVALASSRTADVIKPPRPRKRDEKQGFVEEVERVLRSADRQFRRQFVIRGASGHAHRATLFLPEKDTLLEPIGADGSWNIASAVYVRFGDLRQVNGHRFVSVLDDRTKAPELDVLNLLQQVSNVVSWTRRPQWERQIFF